MSVYKPWINMSSAFDGDWTWRYFDDGMYHYCLNSFAFPIIKTACGQILPTDGGDRPNYVRMRVVHCDPCLDHYRAKHHIISPPKPFPFSA